MVKVVAFPGKKTGATTRLNFGQRVQLTMGRVSGMCSTKIGEVCAILKISSM